MGSLVFSSEQEVELLDGCRLPCETLGDSSSGQLIWCHGLGPQEPWAMNRRSCDSFQYISDTVSVPDAPFNVVLYDARGHGSSTGWEPFAQQLGQFHWRNLAFDMLTVAARHRPAGCEHRGAIIGGFSMGASTALWAAYLCPTMVRGLVLLNVTTAWEIRAARRGNLIANADALEKANNMPAACVVRGAAFADLPSVDELVKAELQMPIFLASARDDATHPAAVIERLHDALPTSKVFIAETTEELKREYPAKLREWYKENFA